MPEEVISIIIEEKSSSGCNYGISLLDGDNAEHGIINDPFAYAVYVYGGSWTCQDYANHWQSTVKEVVPMRYAKSTDPKNCCAVISLTNAIMFYGHKYNIANINKQTRNQIYLSIRNLQHPDFPHPQFYDPTFTDKNQGGVVQEYMALYGNAALAKQNVNGYVDSSWTKISTFTKVMDTCSAKNKLMLISFGPNSNHLEYKNHVVIGYAYTRLKRTSDGTPKIFVKICDVKDKTPHYVNTTAMNNSVEYLEIVFN